MNERVALLEPTAPLKQHEYHAVPLDPRALDDTGKEGDLYLSSSYEKINAKLRDAVVGMVERGEVDNEDKAIALYELMEIALYASQQSRIDYNRLYNPAELLNALGLEEDSESIERAKKGHASPEELYALLIKYPQLGSLELAKLSHPLDMQATEAMDAEVYDTIISQGGVLARNEPRYKLKGANLAIPARVVLRKKALVNLKTENGTIQVVKRQAYVVRGDLTREDTGIAADSYLKRLVKNPARLPELGEKIEGYLPRFDEIDEDRSRWLLPLATSYYAKYLPEAEAAQ